VGVATAGGDGVEALIVCGTDETAHAHTIRHL
jgi:hypothetical protein